MAWIKVLAGSFLEGDGHHYNRGYFKLLTEASPHGGDDIPVSRVIELSPADPRSAMLYDNLFGKLFDKSFSKESLPKQKIRQKPDLKPDQNTRQLIWQLVNQFRSPVRLVSRTLSRLLPVKPDTTITFKLKFDDGRRMIAVSDINTFHEVHTIFTTKASDKSVIDDTRQNTSQSNDACSNKVSEPGNPPSIADAPDTSEDLSQEELFKTIKRAAGHK